MRGTVQRPGMVVQQTSINKGAGEMYFAATNHSYDQLGEHVESIGTGSIWAEDKRAHQYEGALALEVNDSSGAFRSAILGCAESIFMRAVDSSASISWQEP